MYCYEPKLQNIMFYIKYYKACFISELNHTSKYIFYNQYYKAFFSEPNHTNSKDVENEEDIGNDLSCDEDDDDPDRDKNYEPPSSETDFSDDFPVFNEIQNEVSRNQTSAKTNSNGRELQRLLEEDLFKQRQ
jgi:hypothetical protein